MPGPLLIADLPWLLYRSFFALPRSVRDGEGRPANALLGTVNALLAAVEERSPRAVVCATGAEEAAYRVELYAPYHAHREPMPPELREQWERAPELMGALGWSVADGGELEADDVLGTLAALEESAGGRSLLLTGDRDLLQCAGPATRVLLGGKEDLGAAEVEQRLGVPPGLVPDLIALRGDPSDGLPGAPGVGAKTAADLLRRHGSLEGALAAAGDERPRVAAALRDNAELLATFKEIARLRPVAGIAPPPDRETDRTGGAAHAEALGLDGLAKRLRDRA